MTGEQIEEFERVIAEGGLAIFPTDTVYGLGTHPDSVEGTHRLYWIKGRSPDRPAAVLFFDLERKALLAGFNRRGMPVKDGAARAQ